MRVTSVLRSPLQLALVASLLMCSLSSQIAHAWGEVGHETIAAIALKHLNPDVKAKVEDLLGSDDFVTSALWADKIKYVSAWCHTAPYHFADIPDQADYLDTLKNESGTCSGKPDVIQALLKAETQLTSAESSKADKLAALKFMIHFVGDLHQPLHVGRPSDKGGNEISITWFDKETNLHSVWDTYLINSAHSDDFGSKSIEEQADWYAGYLDGARQNEGEMIDPASWLAESKSARVDAYSGYDDQPSYQKKNIQLIERQIKAAGYRLASWLNSTLSDSYQMSAADSAFRSNIKAICPEFENSIELTQYSLFDRMKIQMSTVVPFSHKKACSQEFQDLD